MALVNLARKLMLAASLLAPSAAFADDIDLFKGGTPITGQKPNVLIIVDNSANWNRNDQGWPVGKQGESELQAMSNVIGGLTGDVRLGLMMFVKGTGSTKDGGYVRFAIRDMDATSRTAFQAMLAGIKPVFNDQNAGQQVAAANADYGAVMYEAFKYFSNSTPYADMAALRDYSGNGSASVNPYTAGNLTGNAFVAADSTTYVGPLSSDTPCNKNFIIFIGNGFPSTSSVNPTTLGDAALAKFDATQIYDEGTKTTYLDEWARFLRKYGASNAPCDVNGICADGPVTTYTIDVYKDHQDVPQTNLLKSTASIGGGKYFAATSEAEIQDALTRILNEIQAVNSVFTSASLPVSVNTQGTYLNQIYMGVFRPDATGAPRWMGNLKQYKFNLTTDATGADLLFLADADGKAAVNSQTGFVDPSARSYWSKSTAPAAGFWAYSPSAAGGQYDAPDGDLVEKGGAAQMLRNLGPTARTVYTCTPNCTTGAAPSLFESSNASLVTALTSTSSSVTLSRSSTTVTATTAADLSLSSPTDTVNLNTNVVAYNASFTATTVDATHFTFPIAETPVTPATGASITVSAGSSVSQSVPTNAVTYSNGVVMVNLPAHGFINGQSVTIAGADVSAAMSTATTKCAGWTATGTCEYNGTFNIAYIDANNFSYTPLTTNYGTVTTTITGIDPPDPIVAPYGSTTITCRTGSTSTSSTVANSLISRPAAGAAGTTKLVSVAMSSVPATCTNPLVTTGNGRVTAISVSGSSSSALNIAPASVSYGAATCGAGMHYCFNVTLVSVVSSSTSSSIVPASPATGTITATGIPTRTVTSITRTAGNASNVATVTVTTALDHGFGAATSVLIAGADQTEYNGSKSTAADGLSIPSGSNTMSFNLTTGPATPATGTANKGTSILAATLINWIRGVDNKEDENINASLTDVRASVHGDVLHSRPLVINYGGTTGIYAFYGSNDGTFRSTKVGQNEGIGSTDGQEVWSFVAPEHYSKLGRLYNNTPLIKYAGQDPPRTPRDYYFDGNIGVYQSADLATTHIFISMRRGGRFIYALDVSNPTAPRFLWKKSYTDTGFSELGYTWSEPKVIALKKTGFAACNSAHSGLSTDTDSSYVRALVFGAGYDPASDDTDQSTVPAARRPDATMGRGVFVLKAEDGSPIKLLQAPADDFKNQNNSARRYPIPSDVTLLDTDGDGCIDRVYVGDTGAKIHRFDIGDPSSANWTAYTIATFGDSGNNGTSNDRRILFPPEVVLSAIGGSQVAYVMVGTGDREQPASATINDRFYMIRDTMAVGAAVSTSTSTTKAVRESQLWEITDFNAATTDIRSTVVNDVSCTQNSSKSTSAPCFFGWSIPYDTGEKSVNAPLTVAGTTFFGTNMPKKVDPKSCEPNLGIARGYALNFLTGTSAFGDRTGDGFNQSDLYATFKGGGLPPSPVSGVVQISDSKTVRFIIGGGGAGVAGSVIEGTKLQVNPSGVRTRVFWYFKKDE